MESVDRAVRALDAGTADRVLPALTWLRSRTRALVPETSLVRQYLVVELPRRLSGDGHEQHESAWALGDLFAQVGADEQAALCRSSAVHETLAVWQWTQ